MFKYKEKNNYKSYIILILAVIVVLGPLYVIIINSFKTQQEYLYNGIFSLPANFLNFDNYNLFLEKSRILTGFKNSLILVVVASIGNIIMGSMVAYVLNRFEFKFKKLVMASYIMAAIVPAAITEVTRFKLISSMGLYNTRLAAIILYLSTNIIQVYIFLQFMEKIPVSLDESAMIDGASYFKIFRLIIFPLLKPATITVLILKSVEIYNNMFIPYLYMPKRELMTATISLMNFAGDRASQWNVMSAGVIILLIPPIIIYLFLQKYIIAGAVSGSVKN